MENFYGNFNLHWWVGVVEDRFDPLYLGRCKVRIVGYHTPNKSFLSTEDLPWCYPVQPITSAAMSGKGNSPVGPLEGTWVLGFFRDGEDCQEPVMFGTMAGIPGKSYYEELRNSSNYGFQDPNKVYPLDDYLLESEPDTNRLARNQNISKTIVKTKDDSREKNVNLAIENDTWDQPLTPYNALYPFNHVYESESGHIFEVDDTPGNERIATYHKSGTYNEIDVNGTQLTKVVGDNYEIYLRHNNVLVKGNCNITVEGNCELYVKNDCDIEVDGNMRTHVHGDYELNVAGNLDIVSGKELNLYSSDKTSLTSDGLEIKSKGSMAIESRTGANIKAGTTMNIMGTIKTSIGSPITEVATLKFNAFSMFPFPPPQASGADELSKSPVSGESPTLPTFDTLIVPTRREVLTFTLDILSEDFNTNAEIITQLLDEAVQDGIITEEEINAPQPEATEIDDEPAPEKIEEIPGCGEINNVAELTESFQISSSFKIEDLTYKAALADSGRRLIAQGGLSKREIACNLKALAEQVLDPIKARYPNMIITSGFRTSPVPGGAINSQHLRGEAADLQFPGVSKSEYYNIARWIKQNVNYDQMLLEYQAGGNPWIHITFSRNGNRNTQSTYYNNKTAINGRGVLLQLEQLQEEQ